MAHQKGITGINRVTLAIMGDDYVVTGNESTEYMKMLGRLLEERIEEISNEAGDLRLSKTQLAVLAALQLADDYQRIFQEHDELLQILREAK